jgi:SpoVK/Ycf46/Vps4 family AAA+-type ATPase
MEVIKSWITDSYENNKKLSLNSCLFISGNSGTGKTHSINNIAKELNLFIVNIDSFNCSSSVQLNDLLMKSFISSLIQILTSNTAKKIIIIDDYDILIALDNNINITLYNFINNNTNKLKHIPIICIINNSIVKKLGDIKKKCKIMNFPNMNEYEIYEILKIYNSKITFSDALKIIIKYNYNLSDIIKTISNTYYDNNDEIIINDYIYSNNFNRDYLRRIVSKEQWLIPLNFHENIIIELYNNRNGIKKEKEIFYKNFLLNFCYFDVIMNKSNEIGIELFISIIEGLFKIPNKKNKKVKLANFTKMLSYLSLQKKNNKNFYNNKSFPFHNIGNYHLNIINRKFIY